MNVVLTTLNSKFIHSSLALRYLKAYGKSQGQAYDIVEYTINMPVLNILSDITERDIDVIGFACYIWNIEMTLHVVALLKTVKPDIIIVLGGPEVSYVADEILHRAPSVDYIVQGEGEEVFTALIQHLSTYKTLENYTIDGIRSRDVHGQPCGSSSVVEVKDLSVIPFPYTEEDMSDLAHKIIYYESSRGCPFSCQYCLSGNKNTVRFFSQKRTISELQWFIDHHVKQVKFVDRTFNCAPMHHLPLMEFISQADTRTNFHLEMEAELMGEREVSYLCNAPKGRIQIEVGVQSTYPKTLKAIHRYNNWQHIKKVIRPIIESGNTHVHMDLIVGLPHETKKRFGLSFDDLFSLQPHALQIGFLKLLKGSGIRAMDDYHYIFDPLAPYEVLGSHVLPYEDVRFLKYFEDVFERFYNSERYRTVFTYIGKQLIDNRESAFDYFSNMTKAWLAADNHKRNLNDKDQIEFLYSFFKKHNDIVAIELLQYDVIMSYKGKIRTETIGLPVQSKKLLQSSEYFWKDEQLVRRYIPEYSFKEWRRIRQNYFEVNLSAATVDYLGINQNTNDDYMRVNEKIPIIIDVMNTVKPFIRPAMKEESYGS